MATKYEKIKEKLRDQNRLLEKIRNNSHKRHNSRSNSKKKENEYLSKKSFKSFLENLAQSFNIIFDKLEESFQRDCFISKNLLESQFSTSVPNMVTVKADTHMRLLRFENEILKSGKGFIRPHILPFYDDECFDFQSVIN